jgi:hypothetical protein
MSLKHRLIRDIQTKRPDYDFSVLFSLDLLTLEKLSYWIFSKKELETETETETETMLLSVD